MCIRDRVTLLDSNGAALSCDNESVVLANIYSASSTADKGLSLIHISEPTRRRGISYAVFCLKKKKRKEKEEVRRGGGGGGGVFFFF